MPIRSLTARAHIGAWDDTVNGQRRCNGVFIHDTSHLRPLRLSQRCQLLKKFDKVAMYHAAPPRLMTLDSLQGLPHLCQTGFHRC
jgi:hypothetical protein